MSKVNFTERTAPTTPNTGKGSVYFSSVDKKLHVLDDAGLDTALGSGADTTVTPYVVDAGGSTTYSTVQSAIDAAHTEFTSTTRTQVVYVRPATYLENLTFKPGVAVVGLAEYSPGVPDASTTPATSIKGEHVITEALGAINGSARNISFLMPGAPVNSPATLIQYGTGGAPAAKGSFQFTNCEFNQIAGTFDEAVLRTDATSALNDAILFAECAFKVNTPNPTTAFHFASGSVSASSPVSVVFDRSNLASSRQFAPTRLHDAIISLVSGHVRVEVDGCLLHGTTFTMPVAGTGVAVFEGVQIDAYESGKAVLDSSNVGNIVILDDSTLKATGSPAHILSGPMNLQLGMVALTGFTTDSYDPAQVTLNTGHARLHRGAHQGETLYVNTSPGPTNIPTHVVGVNVGTSAGVISIQMPDAEELQGAFIVVRDADNQANSSNITVLGAVDSGTGGGTQDVISKQGQVVTYVSMNVGTPPTNNWMWVRSGAVK